MENVLFGLVGGALLIAGVVSLLQPKRLRWAPVYKFYERLFDERRALLITRLKVGIGLIILGVILLLYASGML